MRNSFKLCVILLVLCITAGWSQSWEWNTFMGSWLTDNSYGIAVDGSDNVYVAGYSSITWGSPVNAHAGDDDVFIVKLNSSGELQWNTFMGGSEDDAGYGITVDGSGNVYIAGYSSATWGSPVNAHSGSKDAFAVKFDYSNIVKVEINMRLPIGFKLSQNYPNPFTPQTTIESNLPQAAEGNLTIYNINGKEIRKLFNGRLAVGSHTFQWNARDNYGNLVSSGIYFYQFEAQAKDNKVISFFDIKKMILLR